MITVEATTSALCAPRYDDVVNATAAAASDDISKPTCMIHKKVVRAITTPALLVNAIIFPVISKYLATQKISKSRFLSISTYLVFVIKFDS